MDGRNLTELNEGMTPVSRTELNELSADPIRQAKWTERTLFYLNGFELNLRHSRKQRGTELNWVNLTELTKLLKLDVLIKAGFTL